MHSPFSRIVWCIALIALQALVFNHIHIAGYAMPMPYIYLLLTFPHHTARWVYVVVGFAVGLLLDMVSNTPGMASSALTLTGLLTPRLLRAFTPNDKLEDDFLPSPRIMQWGGYLFYIGTCSLLACTAFYVVESFSFFNPLALVLNIAGSWLLTLPIIATLERIRSHPKKS